MQTHTHAHTRTHMHTHTQTCTHMPLTPTLLYHSPEHFHEHFHIPEMIAGRRIEFLENDLDVDDVDDDAKDAGAYFFFVRQSDGHTNYKLHS